ncbi:probable ribosome-binding factor A, chloroplastic isoform X1 [Arachis ipaensis]|nr:probable ribosome-binding factor A, chloroplastic isoform X1 [Arachis ipaensis]XP_020968344.1 probable ribosome-binding factor A, chloroplastic isoform X1 [Arachis ipaensis]XP_020968345.1 probable ribosome-binding factor A, chloroplastic isoform X1 [Arachis ipaensis]
MKVLKFGESERAMTYLLPPPLILPCPCGWWNHILAPPSSTATTMNPVQRRGLSGSGQPGEDFVGRSRSRSVRCMANPRRVKMVAKQIQRELSDMLLTDKVLQFAVLPEASLGADRYLSSLTTISDVEVSSDLQVVKVYVSVFGDERGKEVAMAGLKSKAKYVRSVLGRRMKLRLTPEIRFIEDESFERGSRVIAILDKIKNEKSLENQNGELLDSSAHDDDNWDDVDPDEGIIYVD